MVRFPKKSLAIAAILISATACGTKGTGDLNPSIAPPSNDEAAQKAPAPSGPQESQESKDALVPSMKVELKTGAEANAYSSRIHWTYKSGFAGVYRITRTAAREESREFTRSADQSAYEDADVKPGVTYTYTLAALEGGTTVDVDTQSLTIPLDAEVKGTMTPESLATDASAPVWTVERYNRVFFREGAILRTGAKELHLRAGEIIAEGSGATIENFEQGQQAGVDQDGRTGGAIFISVDSGFGKLNVVSRGERGGNGSKGPKGPKGPAGSPGRDFVQRGGEYYDWACHNPSPVPGTGGDGGQGGAGGQGAPGRHGGDAAKITISVRDTSQQFKINPISLPGEPGAGGPGGDGGDGGDAGAGGRTLTWDKKYQRFECPVGRGGNAGPAGPQGPNGPTGTPGQSDGSCLDLSGYRVGC